MLIFLTRRLTILLQENIHFGQMRVKINGFAGIISTFANNNPQSQKINEYQINHDRQCGISCPGGSQPDLFPK
jgi:hypothetical protein